MTDELKKVLAIAVPVGFLLVSAMVIYGPGAKIEGAPVQARRRRSLDGDEDLATLTPSEINRRLDRLDKLSSKLTDEFIAAGRGHELPSETFKKTDPLAERKRRVWADSDALHREISRRYGPGAPSRLPTRRTR
jgi:hypothetical protein